MADAAPPTGTSSTPEVLPGGITAQAAATPPAEPQKAPAAAAPATPAPSAEAPPAAPAKEAAAPETPKTDATPAPLFELPQDLTIAPEAVTKFETVVKAALKPDGTVSLKPQELLNAYLDQARDAHARWEKQLEELNTTNEATCKQRFSAQQLSSAETAVGFLSSFDPAFRDLAKRQLNDPTFVNAMRLVGERLSEDTFEPAGRSASATKSPREMTRAERAQRMGYTKSN
jgi:hypothetical protein